MFQCNEMNNTTIRMHGELSRNVGNQCDFLNLCQEASSSTSLEGSLLVGSIAKEYIKVHARRADYAKAKLL